MMLFRICLDDGNSDPIMTAGAEYFTFDLDEFKRLWFSSSDADKERIAKFRKAEDGALIADVPYVNAEEHPEYTMVMKSDADMLGMKSIEMCDSLFYLENFYGMSEKYHADKMVFDVIAFEFIERYYAAARYSIEGLSEKHPFYDDRWLEPSVYGNQIAKYDKRTDIAVAGDTQFFSSNRLSSFAYVPFRKYDDKNSIMEYASNIEITQNDLKAILKDIIGQAG